MLIYNVTSKVDPSVHAQWLNWMERVYLPAILDAVPVANYTLTRLLGVDDSQGPTYALLMEFATHVNFKTYVEEYKDGHEKAIRSRWGEGVLSFASMLDVVLKG